MPRIAWFVIFAVAAGFTPAVAAEKPVTATSLAAATTPASPASATERSNASRLDPLARAAFWAREQAIDPLDPQAALGMAGAMRALGRFDEAAQAAQMVLVSQPDNAAAHLEAARCFIGAGRGFYAIEHLQAVQRVSPNDWRASSLLAVALDQSQRPDEALVAHQRALALAPNEPLVLTNFAMFVAGQGHLTEAEDLLRRAAALPGAPVATRQNLALVIGLQGRITEAERLVRMDLPPEAVDNNLTWLRAAVASPRISPGG
jgi:Flp pilus assembly protein TadD